MAFITVASQEAYVASCALLDLITALQLRHLVVLHK
jgi:hypothetical protein